MVQELHLMQTIIRMIMFLGMYRAVLMDQELVELNSFLGILAWVLSM